MEISELILLGLYWTHDLQQTVWWDDVSKVPLAASVGLGILYYEERYAL